MLWKYQIQISNSKGEIIHLRIEILHPLPHQLLPDRFSKEKSKLPVVSVYI